MVCYCFILDINQIHLVYLHDKQTEEYGFNNNEDLTETENFYSVPSFYQIVKSD